MHDSAIKSFCVWARRELISEVERRCALFDISEKPESPKGAQAVGGTVLSAGQRHQRDKVLDAVRAEGYEHVVERAAYTWFNRIMAIRFMELNDRLPSRTRLLSANDGSFKPQALSEALQMDIGGIDRTQVAQLVQEGDDEATFRYLFLAQCAELAECMPDVFEKVGSATELLLPDGLLRKDGVIARMVEDIPEEDWREGVEIVGWMYQYYVSERKDEYFASKRKATREDLPPATQLFTPAWIVRYLTENSLGRLWMLNFPDSTLAERMEYCIAPGDDAEPDFRRIESPEELTAVDPACGSGHILVYAFDLLAAMYEEQGYSRRDIPRHILESNLTGLEVDPRAAAMASFALTMKACEYDGRFLNRGVRPRITVLSRVEFDEDERTAIARIMKDQERLDAPFLLEQTELLDVLAHLDEAGSLFQPTEADLGSLRAVAETVMDEADMFGMGATEKAQQALAELEPLARRYDAVIANPPYLGSGNMDGWLSTWVKANYPDEKSDLCTCFIARGLKFAKDDGIASVITSDTCMYISSFEKMRNAILSGSTILTLIDTRGTNAHPDVFDANAGWVLAKGLLTDYKGAYFKLNQRIGEKQNALQKAIRNPECGWFYRADQQDFKKIPGSPIAYWTSKAFVRAFENKIVSEYAKKVCKGPFTGDNARFLRLWTEVSRHAIDKDDWHLYSKGGSFRKWYGNTDYVVWWKNDGADLKAFPKSGMGASQYYGLEHFVWTGISSGLAAFRYDDSTVFFDDVAPAIVFEREPNYTLLGLLNCSVVESFLRVIAPTIHFQAGDIKAIPVHDGIDNESAPIVLDCVSLSRTDWDSYETSWEFTEHPLVRHHAPDGTLVQAYESWNSECNERFYQLKSNEEKLNRIFAEIYHMENEVPIEVPLDKVSVHIVFDSEDDVPDELKNGNYVRTKADEVKSLISYAVGCIVGRYSLDKPGLVLANQGDGLPEYLQQVPEPTFAPDADGIIRFTDVEYFHDDAVGLFVDFMRAAFGEEHLEDNLRFVADALGGSGTPRQVIRAYFRDEFFADHCKTYSVQSAGKRPVYWLFDSGKKGGFRALFYMHRYTPDLLARLRTEYVLPQQERYRMQIANIDDTMATADRREMADLKKRRKKLSDQLDEINVYEEKVHHLADQMIEIDLDDGVKHNYALFQDVLAKIK